MAHIVSPGRCPGSLETWFKTPKDRSCRTASPNPYAEFVSAVVPGLATFIDASLNYCLCSFYVRLSLSNSPLMLADPSALDAHERLEIRVETIRQTKTDGKNCERLWIQSAHLQQIYAKYPGCSNRNSRPVVIAVHTSGQSPQNEINKVKLKIRQKIT